MWAGIDKVMYHITVGVDKVTPTDRKVSIDKVMSALSLRGKKMIKSCTAQASPNRGDDATPQ